MLLVMAPSTPSSLEDLIKGYMPIITPAAAQALPSVSACAHGDNASASNERRCADLGQLS